ncbi:MAG: hypothetical protein NUV77_04405 [Thermoguttaceae bacterium]|nr:hypothetical protein [Thermoguttaceae bacterium]
MSEVLRQRLIEEPLGLDALSAATGVAKWSLSRFMQGKGGLTTLSTDKLFTYFNLRVVEGPRRTGRRAKRPASAKKGR